MLLHTNNDEILIEAINKYGIEAQSRQAMEEFAELIQATNKCIRYPTQLYLYRLTEEIADAQIMMRQLMIMYDIEKEDVDTAVSNKIKKLAGNL